MTEKVIVFDSGVLISFSMNGITDVIKNLKGIFKGKFLITQDVENEIVTKPIKIKKFELEALKLKELIDTGILEFPIALGINNSEITKITDEILDISNKIFQGKKSPVKLLDRGECSCLALSQILNKKKIINVLAIDERTTRSLIEDSEGLRKYLEKKLSTKITADKNKLVFFKDFKIIRSPELAYVAFKKNLINLKNGNVLEAFLHALKYKGASISYEEIEEMKNL